MLTSIRSVCVGLFVIAIGTAACTTATLPAPSDAAGPKSAASSDGPTGSRNVCDEILAYGVFDTFDNYSNKDRYRLTQTAVCTESYNSLAKAQSAKGSLGLDLFDILGLDASGGYDEQTYRTAFSHYCSQSYDKNLSNDMATNRVKKASPIIASAWTSCIEAIQTGFVYYVQPSRDRKAFSVVLRYKGDGVTRLRIDKVTFTPSKDVHCEGLPKIPSQLDTNFLTFSCTKPQETEVIVGAETDRGFVHPVTVPGLTEVPPSLEQRLAALEAPRPRTEVATIGSDCKIISQSGPWMTLKKNDKGGCAATFEAGAFSTAPVCIGTSYGTNGAWPRYAYVVRVNGPDSVGNPTTLGATFRHMSVDTDKSNPTPGEVANESFAIACTGPR